ncbi:thiol peroxidase [Enterococcus caccae]|uniref:AhpC/TSA family protein n=1 Tax=Enterococcus caccae ATCC BAA-1240 TaxID=1158612 RepID=R3X5L0_9ENTE|nr:thiol peroxidase [Enterococcus caccae]EOL49335.1 AhpC/TSA family protein [Enterococcus caccae ATCC BAA-1240]EOT56387.1 AhpC/TSA family protein [Enterococcus caccae ATCC BAA-1240]OJG24276.1 AhpC/TSA family protein [Enterococcus caccae]
MKVTKKGEEVEIIGVQPEVGDQAPEFSLKNLKDEMVNLSDFAGLPVLISVVPDIDTRICSLQTKRFNQEAANVEGVKFITISNNTKEEQANWCAAEGVDMEILHDTEGTFGEAYGLFIPEMGRLARGIFVIDKDGTLVYEAISTEIAEEPDYAAALDKIASIL